MPEITVWEKPRPQQRHRTAGGHEYTPTETLEAQHWIREAWRQAGHPKLDGPAFELTVWCYITRPRGHFGTGRNAGMLRPSAPPFPTERKRDWDNLGKLVSDALNDVAYPDDAYVCNAHVFKRYSDRAAWVISVEILTHASAMLAAVEAS
jgi:Holliday junction resolvase RusA-like endonuclease